MNQLKLLKLITCKTKCIKMFIFLLLILANSSFAYAHYLLDTIINNDSFIIKPIFSEDTIKTINELKKEQGSLQIILKTSEKAKIKELTNIIGDIGVLFLTCDSNSNIQLFFSELIKRNKQTLNYLLINNFSLQNIPKEISEFKNLKNLILYSKGNTEFPLNIYKCKELEYLGINGYNFDKIPNGISVLKKLKKIEIHNCCFIELPIDFFKLNKLEEISFFYSKCFDIKDLIIKISKIDNLINCLNLSNCEIKKLPFEFFDLINIKIIELWGNQINDNDINKLKSNKIWKRIAIENKQ